MAKGQGRSSGQGVKLLVIRDYLRSHTDKSHCKNATEIKTFLATKGIEASEKTIYNDLTLLKYDFKEPIEYSAKNRGYYITEPQFEPKELRMMVNVPPKPKPPRCSDPCQNRGAVFMDWIWLCYKP